jgi:prepilin-type N-terminal cleavage/methylation domain-containing protein
MRRAFAASLRRGFTLIEILTGLLLLSAAGLMLAAGEKWLLLAMTRTEQRLLARDRGRRVIAFVEPRLLHAGLGLSKCRESGALLRNMSGSGNVPAIVRLLGSNRYVIVYKETSSSLTPAKEENGVISGSAFCVIYGRPSGMIIRARDSAELQPGSTTRFDVVAGDWLESGFKANVSIDLRSWCALPLIGMPLLISSRTTAAISLSLAAGVSSPIDDIPPVNEMMCLCCDRFRVRDDVFRFQRMYDDWSPPAFYPREDGVLSMWVEWRPTNGTFDIWVLASGGPAVFGTSTRPFEWPDGAPWLDEFAAHELYVSRASWRLENV